MVDHSSLSSFTASMATTPLVRLEEKLLKLLKCQAQGCKFIIIVVSIYTRTNIGIAMPKNTLPSFSAAC